MAEDLHENEEAKKDPKSEKTAKSEVKEEKKGLVEKSEEKDDSEENKSEKKEDKKDKIPKLADALDAVVDEKSEDKASGMKIETSSLAQSDKSGDNLLSSANAAKEDAKGAKKDSDKKGAAKEEEKKVAPPPFEGYIAVKDGLKGAATS